MTGPKIIEGGVPLGPPPPPLSTHWLVGLLPKHKSVLSHWSLVTVPFRP